MTAKKGSLLIAIGSGINLSLYGIGVWNGSTTLTNGGLFGSAGPELVDWYIWFATIGLLAGIFLRAAISMLTGSNSRYYAQTTFWAVAAAPASLLSGFWTSSIPAICITAFCTGWAFACLSVFWVVQLHSALPQARTTLPLILLCAAIINAWYAIAPQNQLHVYLGCSLLASTACSILLIARNKKASTPPPHRITSVTGKYISAFSRFAEVIFCVIALQIIAPAMNYMGLMNTIDPSTQLAVVCAAQATAAIVVFLALRLIKAPLLSVQLFKYVAPVLIIALFPVPFAGHAYSLIMLFAGSCLHFVVVNALFWVDSIAIARKDNLVFEFFYATGLFVLMVVCVILEQVMPMILQASSSTELLLVFGVFFCIYILSMTFMFARRRKRESTNIESSAQSDDEGSFPFAKPLCQKNEAGQAIDSRIVSHAIQDRHQLSDREAEILEMLLRGKNVPAIAEELIISQNTVRTHVKRIYRATDVHTRQELISYCENINLT